MRFLWRLSQAVYILSKNLKQKGTLMGKLPGISFRQSCKIFQRREIQVHRLWISDYEAGSLCQKLWGKYEIYHHQCGWGQHGVLCAG